MPSSLLVMDRINELETEIKWSKLTPTDHDGDYTHELVDGAWVSKTELDKQEDRSVYATYDQDHEGGSDDHYS